jgi:Flp pilus assembly secretin CpaC
VIGGLLENNVNRDMLRKLPWLAEIPVVGMLFRDKQFDQVKREVLFFMTPEVMKDSEGIDATGAQSPGMQHWITTWNKKGFIQRPNKDGDDWGMHNPDGLGFPHPEKESAAPAKATKATKATGAKPAAAAPAAKAAPAAPSAAPATDVEKPAATPSQDTSTNFSPARPAE